MGDLALIDEVESAQTHRSQAFAGLKTVFEQYIQNYKKRSSDIRYVIKLKESGELADYIVNNTADAGVKQMY